jgi:N-acetylneuraminic acid mutarotase
MDDNLYIFGGQDFGVGVYSDLWMFSFSPDNSSQERWRELKTSGDLPVPLCRHQSLIYNRKLYLLGGNDGSRENTCVYVLDLISLVWGKAAGSFPGIDSFASVLFNGKFVVFGGYSGGSMSNDLHLFDLAQEQSIKIEVGGEKPEARVDHRGTLHNDAMWVYGGKGEEENLDDLWKLDLSTYIWTKIQYLGNSPGTVSGHSLVTYGDVMLVFGGIRDVLKETNEMYTYDFVNNNWVLIQTETQIDDPVTPLQVDQFNKKLKKMDHLEPAKLNLYTGAASPVQGRVDNRVPHSRDGHSAVLYSSFMIVFGGDRHQMAFNDLYCYSVFEQNRD